jgi:hypothetical protein
VKGAGLIETDGTCILCTNSTGLQRFTFTLDDNAFIADSSLSFLRDRNVLSGSLHSDFHHLVFTPSGHAHYADRGAGHGVIRHGEYRIDAETLTSTPVGLAESTPVAVVPEPASVVLLMTVFGVTALLVRRRKRAAPRADCEFGRLLNKY